MVFLPSCLTIHKLTGEWFACGYVQGFSSNKHSIGSSPFTQDSKGVKLFWSRIGGADQEQQKVLYLEIADVEIIKLSQLRSNMWEGGYSNLKERKSSKLNCFKYPPTPNSIPFCNTVGNKSFRIHFLILFPCKH